RSRARSLRSRQAFAEISAGFTRAVHGAAPLRVFVSDREVYEALPSRFARLAVKATAVGSPQGDGKWSGSRHPPRADAHVTADAWAAGSRMEKVAPGPWLDSAHSCPWWASMIERLIARPRPIPCGLVV